MDRRDSPTCLHPTHKVLGADKVCPTITGKARTARPLPNTPVTKGCARCLLAIVAATILASCAIQPPTSVPSLGTLRAEGFEPLATDYPGTILKRHAPSAYTWIFIESDGAAFGSWPTGKPAPPKVQHSVALSLARKVASDTAVYLSRPCQFLFGTPPPGQCLDPLQWTMSRYGDDQLRLIEDAIRQTLGAAKTDLILVGHSGGGVIALRLAQRAQLPIHCTITLASPIDVRAWQRHHQTSAALDITDPGDLVGTPSRFRAIFLFGSNDQTVPPSAIGRWAKEARRGSNIHEITLAASHNHGWSDALDLIDFARCTPKRKGKP